MIILSIFLLHISLNNYNFAFRLALVFSLAPIFFLI